MPRAATSRLPTSSAITDTASTPAPSGGMSSTVPMPIPPASASTPARRRTPSAGMNWTAANTAAIST